MMGLLGQSRKAERKRKRRWQALGLLLLALAAALYWLDRSMTGRSAGRIGEWLPSTGGTAHPAAESTAPAGTAPMAGAAPGAADAVGLRAETATVDVAEPAAETVTQAPPAEPAPTGNAPEPGEWQEALEGDAATTEDVATTSPASDLTPTIADAAGWVEGDGTNVCPEGYPIKGNATSRIFHRPGESSYEVTRAEICFATEADAAAAGYRPRKR